MTDEQLDQAWTDQSRASARRHKTRQTDLRGPEREERLAEILTTAVLEVARNARDPKEYWWSGKLRHAEACKYVAQHVPPQARALIRKRHVPWQLIAKYTADLKGLRREDDQVARHAEAGGGLLANL